MSKPPGSQKPARASGKDLDITTLNAIARRALYLATQMIHRANSRDDKEKGDPKVGGHQSASASSLHILGALHLVVQTGFDHLAVKPHASPTNHAYNYLLNLFLHEDLSRFSLEDMNTAMDGLRKYSNDGRPVFQSYHSHFDPDHHNFFPSGTVGIPPVNAGYLALAYRYAAEHGYKTPEQAHFWCLIGDSEFREGSLYEALPDFAEREIGNLTWIVDYNRQSLDGHRITNKKIMDGTDDKRIERTARANGWDVIQVRHGAFRRSLFARPGGELFQKFLEEELEDYEFQALLLVHDMKKAREELYEKHPHIKNFVKALSDEDLRRSLSDLGGHDFEALIEAMQQSKQNTRRPTLIVAHTVKGWGLSIAAASGNHSSLVSDKEVEELRKREGITGDTLYAGFEPTSQEGKYLKARGDELYGHIVEENRIKKENEEFFRREFERLGEFPKALDINLKMVNYPHTQWMLGQLTAKLIRFANTPWEGGSEKYKPLAPHEKPFKLAGELMVSMAPDVGTSTNLNPAMDGKIFGAPVVEDIEAELNVKDDKLPDLVPGEDVSDRFLRFEIAEGNVMSCMGSFGRLRDVLGIPLLPLMTVYDFFVKRALDQFFYNLYWRSSFILVGTPAGVTLSPEGAQHGWKSDIQIPNQITWEPFFATELDWILTDSIRRHMLNDNAGRTGVFIRGVTRGIDQKMFYDRLKQQARFKRGLSDGQLLAHSKFPLEGAIDESTLEAASETEVMEQIRENVLKGAYYLIDYRGYAGYEPGDNVVNILSLGSPTTEAIKASDALLERGIYANVIVVTNTDLLLGNLAHADNYAYLREELGINGTLHLQPLSNGAANGAEVKTLSGRRVPIVSVHDGEPGLLDNAGSIVGVRQEVLAVRKHSKSGRPADIYHLHGIDSEAIVEAAGKVLAETALEEVRVSERALSEGTGHAQMNWRELWPERAD
ncbi:MAG TPA: pyruvate dehydrogenase [Bdellovibrionales bacterium]|nr:pyruvate dehydrogenase [Bdellovibrionales bacterium]